MERRGPSKCLKIDVTASSNELLRDGLMPSGDREVERREPTLHLNMDVTARSNELFSDGLKPFFGRDVERCAPTLTRLAVITSVLVEWNPSV